MELQIELIPTGEIIRVVSRNGEHKTVSLIFYCSLFSSCIVSCMLNNLGTVVLK